MNMNAIHLMDNVRVVANQNSSHTAREFAGCTGTVFAKRDNEVLLVLAHGAQLCLPASEVRVTSGLAERMMA